MVFSIVIFKLVDWFLYHILAYSCYRAVRKIRTYVFLSKNSSLKSSSTNFFPNLRKFSPDNSSNKTLVCDIDGALLTTPSFFPYFMLVAFEGGGILRSLLLLLSCPILCILSHELKLKTMIFITFCGLSVKDMDTVSRAVLPKFFLENLHLQAYEAFASAGNRIVFSSVPRVMISGFLNEYMSANHVFGTELQTVNGYFTGFVTDEEILVKHKATKEYFDGKKPDIGLGSSSFLDHLFMSLCTEAYVVTNEGSVSQMPREKYPKPLVFHDGRLAFLPTPFSILAMFLWLPLGFLLAILRLIGGIILPYKLIVILGAISGVRLSVNKQNQSKEDKKNGVLYVCSHRTLLDPVFLGISLEKPIAAVTYSLSKMSEIMAPLKTVRLTRDRKLDGDTMKRLLSEGDLVVCPEGTTCREPYLLRFSSLFAELSDEIIPVAMKTDMTMFYGTTASGYKFLDPIFFFMNPSPSYSVEFLEKLPKEMTCLGGSKSVDVANYVQKKLAEALGFQCTCFTRRDKYMMLAGNDGLVNNHRKL